MGLSDFEHPNRKALEDGVNSHAPTPSNLFPSLTPSASFPFRDSRGYLSLFQHEHRQSTYDDLSIGSELHSELQDYAAKRGL